MNLIDKLIIKLWEKTLTYKSFRFVKDTYYYIKDYLYISDTLYSDEFKLVLLKYTGLEVSKDWIGRLYGIINPTIDIDGKFDVNNMIIELDGENTNNLEYIKSWMHRQLILITSLFKLESLTDYIDIDFKHVGPINMDNYLIIFDIVSRKKMVDSFKSFLPHFTFYIILACIGIAIYLL